MALDITHYEFFKKLTELPFIDEIWLYGSRARGTHSERADIDLAILGEFIDYKQWFLVQDIIEDADTLLQIDCINFNLIKNENFKKNILNDKKILFKRKI